MLTNSSDIIGFDKATLCILLLLGIAPGKLSLWLRHPLCAVSCDETYPHYYCY